MWLLSTVLGARQVRFAWIAVMLLVGSLGVYFLAHRLLTLIFLRHKQLPEYLWSLAALVAALFYLANPAMVQFFLVFTVLCQ